MKSIKEYRNIYMVGIKGVGMASLAILLKGWGASIFGSDIDEYFHTQDDLEEHSISIVSGFHTENIDDTMDLVITSGAHEGLQNPEVIEATKRGIKVMTHAEALGETMKEFTNRIAVCGSHGKTTTSAFIAHTLKNLNLNPAAIIGSAHNNYDNFESDYIVVEADEYATAPPENKTPRFMYLSPSVVVCTNIDFDHPDIYSNIDEITSVFATFFKKIDDKGMIIAYGDDPYIREVLQDIPWDRYITYGMGQNNNLVISDIRENKSGMSFKATLKKDGIHEEYLIKLYGNHNVMNGAAVILTGIFYGKTAQEIKHAMSTFLGTKRRMEEIFKLNNTYLFDDYGHHPTEIEATLTTFKRRFPDNRLVVVFQPHTISRTKALEKDFIRSLRIADRVIITDIFLSAREKIIANDITSYDVVMHAEQEKKFIYAPVKDLMELLNNEIKPHDIVLTLGAGDLYKYHSDIISHIKKVTIA